MSWARRKIGAAAVIFDSKGRVLLVRHTYGRLNWELPGGASELGETVVETALREVREETGLGVAAEWTTGIYYDPEHDAHHFVFRCRIEGRASPPHPNSPEISECAYWPTDSLPRPISDFTIRRIQDGLAGEDLPLPVSIRPRTWID